MSFVSYAQNFEDVMLWRALKHIPEGTYVDVGAQHPVVDSVSKAFYEHGWRGIHIEPVAAYADLLRADRPGDTVLQVALAAIEGVLELNVFPDTGLSTAVDQYAERHQEQHGFEHSTVTVPVLTLRSALRGLEGKNVHWLKIDVEGFEEQVLRGWDSSVLRPWIMVIEATVPSSAETDYAGWDPILLAANYRFAYFDGLNRFYVAEEHAELMTAFASPPNVFDAVRLSGLASSELCRGVMIAHDVERDIVQRASQAELTALHERAAAQRANDQAERDAAFGERDAAIRERDDARTGQANAVSELDGAWRDISRLGEALVEAEAEKLKMALELELMRRKQHDSAREEERLHAHIAWMQTEIDASKVKVDELNQSSHHWWTTAQSLNARLDDMHSSKIWYLTAPLRVAGDYLRNARRLLRRPINAATIKGLLRRVLRAAVRRPLVRAAALRVLHLAPGLAYRARRFIGPMAVPQTAMVDGALDTSAADHSAHLPQRQVRELSPRAAAILADIKKAIDAKES